MPRNVCSRSLLPSMVLSIPIIFAVLFTTAHAESTHSLRAAADDYRQAALDFERYVQRAGYFNQYDKRLADRHADISSEFRSASRSPRDISRLLYHWGDLNAIHFRIEETVVRRCLAHDPDLGRVWHLVDDAYECLVYELRHVTDHHHH